MGYCISIIKKTGEYLDIPGLSNGTYFLMKLEEEYYSHIKREIPNQSINYDYNNSENKNNPIINLKILKLVLKEEF